MLLLLRLRLGLSGLRVDWRRQLRLLLLRAAGLSGGDRRQLLLEELQLSVCSGQLCAQSIHLVLQLGRNGLARLLRVDRRRRGSRRHLRLAGQLYRLSGPWVELQRACSGAAHGGQIPEREEDLCHVVAALRLAHQEVILCDLWLQFECVA